MYFTWKLAAVPAAENHCEMIRLRILHFLSSIVYAIFPHLVKKSSVNPVLFSDDLQSFSHLNGYDDLPDLFILPGAAGIRSDQESVHLWREQNTDCFLPLCNILSVLRSFR